MLVFDATYIRGLTVYFVFRPQGVCASGTQYGTYYKDGRVVRYGIENCQCCRGGGDFVDITFDCGGIDEVFQIRNITYCGCAECGGKFNVKIISLSSI